MKCYVSTVIEKDNKFLLVREAKEKYYGKWSLPAGHIEENEYIFNAAIREVKEETNLDVELDGLISVYNNLYEGFYSIAFVFSSKIKNTNEFDFDKNEILELKWFTFEEIQNMADDIRDKDYTITSIKRYIDKDIKPLETIIVR